MGLKSDEFYVVLLRVPDANLIENKHKLYEYRQLAGKHIVYVGKQNKGDDIQEKDKKVQLFIMDTDWSHDEVEWLYDYVDILIHLEADKEYIAYLSSCEGSMFWKEDQKKYCGTAIVKLDNLPDYKVDTYDYSIDYFERDLKLIYPTNNGDIKLYWENESVDFITSYEDVSSVVERSHFKNFKDWL